MLLNKEKTYYKIGLIKPYITRGIILLLVLLFHLKTLAIPLLATTPMIGNLDITLSHSDEGLLNGSKQVTIKLYSNGTEEEDIFWQKEFLNLPFSNGNAVITLGPFNDTGLNYANPFLGIEIGEDEVQIELKSTLYAIQSRLAEMALQLENTDALFVSANNMVGIGTSNPLYKLQVHGNIKINETLNGIIFADGTKLTSKNDIPVADVNVYWQPGVGNDIYYNLGKIGIGTTSPAQNLHVSGNMRLEPITITATEENVLVVNSSGDILKRNIPTNVWDGDDNTTYNASNGLILDGTEFKLASQNASLNQILKWDGSNWSPSQDSGTLYTADKGITLNDTIIELDQQSASMGEILKWDGFNWIPSADIDTDTNTTYTASSGLTLAGLEFQLASQNASMGETLKWNGTSWIPSQDSGTLYTGEKGVSINDTIISLAQQNASSSDTLKWNGSQWIPSADLNTTYTGSSSIELSVTTFKLASQNAVTTETLKWNGSQWIPSADIDTDTTYIADKGITLNSTTFELDTGLYWDAVNKRLGIATENPSQTLDVDGRIRIGQTDTTSGLPADDKGTIAFNGSVFKGWDGSSWLTLSGTVITDSSAIWQYNGDHIYVIPTANLGIGLDLPLANFHVSGNVRIDIIPTDDSEIEESVVLVEPDGDLVKRELPTSVWDGDDNTTYNASAGIELADTTFKLASQNAQNGNVLKWNGSAWIPSADIDTDSTYTADKGITLNDTIFELASQNATLGYTLKWNGSAWIPSKDIGVTLTGSNGVTINGSSVELDSGLAWESQMFGMGTSNPTAKLAVVNTNQGEKILKTIGYNNAIGLSIDTSGNAAIGFSSASSYALAVKGFTYLDAFVTPYTAAIGTTTLGGVSDGPTLTLKSVTTNTTSPVFDVQNNSGTSLFWVEENGKVGIGTATPNFLLHVNGTAGKPGGGSWSDSSDSRLKKHINKINSKEALAKIIRMQGVEFEWINPNQHSPGTRASFIAQDLEKIFPDWVQEIEPKGKDKSLIPKNSKAKAISFPHDFNAYLIEAIKEQQRQIDELKKENQELRKRINVE